MNNNEHLLMCAPLHHPVKTTNFLQHIHKKKKKTPNLGWRHFCDIAQHWMEVIVTVTTSIVKNVCTPHTKLKNDTRHCPFRTEVLSLGKVTRINVRPVWENLFLDSDENVEMCCTRKDQNTTLWGK